MGSVVLLDDDRARIRNCIVVGQKTVIEKPHKVCAKVEFATMTTAAVDDTCA